MQKEGLFLKTGFILLASVIFCTTGFAQTGIQDAVKKTTGQPRLTEAQRTVQLQSDQPISNDLSGAGSHPNPVKTGSSTESGSGTTTTTNGRNCAPKYINKPYSITRANFNQLPKERQDFILSNLNKYTIVD